MRFPDRLVTPVMLTSGLLTLTMLYATIAPHAALLAMFGETLSGPLAEIVVRNWGALAAIGGGMLVWGAFHPEVRTMVLVAVGSSKAVFIALVLVHGQDYLTHQAGFAIALDALWVVTFAFLLAGTRRS